MFFRSAEFSATYHGLAVATLKIHIKPRMISRCNDTVFHLEKLKDLACVHEHPGIVSNQFNVFITLEDPVKLQETFKRATVDAAKEFTGESPWSRSGFVTKETLVIIKVSRTSRLARSRDQQRALSARLELS